MSKRISKKTTFFGFSIRFHTHAGVFFGSIYNFVKIRFMIFYAAMSPDMRDVFSPSIFSMSIP